MNAVTNQASPARTFAWLLKREYWEHRGAFVWAQFITGGIAVFFALLGAVIGAISARRNMVGDSITMDDLAEYTRTLGQVGDGLLLGGIGIASVVLAFVVFSTHSAACTTIAATAACCSGNRCRCRTCRPCCPRLPGRCCWRR